MCARLIKYVKSHCLLIDKLKTYDLDKVSTALIAMIL